MSKLTPEQQASLVAVPIGDLICEVIDYVKLPADTSPDDRAKRRRAVQLALNNTILTIGFIKD